MIRTLTLNRLLVFWAVVLIALLPIVFFFAQNSTASAESDLVRYNTVELSAYDIPIVFSSMYGYSGDPTIGSSMHKLISKNSTSPYKMAQLTNTWTDYYNDNSLPIVNIGTNSYKTITICFDLLGNLSSSFNLFQGVYHNLSYVNFYFFSGQPALSICLLGRDKKSNGGYDKYFIGVRLGNELLSITPLSSHTGYEGEWVSFNVRFPSNISLVQMTTRLECAYLVGCTGALSGVNHTYTNSLVDMAMVTNRFDMIDNLFDGFDNSYVDTYYHNGYDDGYMSGNKIGYESGYKEGYSNGITVGQGDVSASISGFFPSIFGGIGSFFKQILSFEVFGISALTFVGTIGAVMLILFFVHFIRG